MSKAAELANLIGNINAGGGGVNRNIIINGAMNVAQRATSATGLGADANTYDVCDRWLLSANGTDGRLTITQDSSAPSGFSNSTKLACTTTDTSIAAGEFLTFTQKIEGQNLQSFAKGTSDAKPFAVSFYVKGNASATYVAELMDNDNSNRHVSKSFTVTTDWTRVELSFPADTTGTFDDDNADSMVLNIWLHGGSTFTSGTLQQTWGTLVQANRAVGISSFLDSTSRTFFITGVQLEVGQNPTEFEHEPFANTLRKCQRYYEKSYNQGTTPGTSTHLGSRSTGGNQAANTTGEIGGYFPFIVTKRAAPTMTIYDQSGNSGKTTISLYGTGTTANQTSSVSNMSETVFFVSRGSAGSPANATEFYVQFEADSEL
tara:strand:- start:91 stop:1212 length:1122 start_codon:yes stop_codon:yes gene_type:complete